MPPLPDGLGPHALAAALAIVLAAGIVRGFAGFGFSALAVAGLSMIVPPGRVVPAILVLEILGSLSLLPQALRELDRAWLRSLVMGNAVAIPAGVALLAFLPEDPLRTAIAASLLVGALALRSGWHPAWQPTAAVRALVGLVSGVFNGLAAIGGIAVAVLLSGGALPPRALRATLIALFLFTDACSLAWAAVFDRASGDAARALVTPSLLVWTAWLAPAMFVGIALGSRVLGGLADGTMRARMADLVLLVAAVSTASALLRWLG